jgi:hypothetical protein
MPNGSTFGGDAQYGSAGPGSMSLGYHVADIAAIDCQAGQD